MKEVSYMGRSEGKTSSVTSGTAAVFLAFDDCGCVQGARMKADGGWTVGR